MARVRRGIAIAFAVATTAIAAGCETFVPHMCDRSDQDNPWLEYDGGTTTCAADGGSTDCVYQTSPYDGEWLLYKGGMRYELYHGLGTTPTQPPTVSLSFDEHGTGGAGGGFAPSAGDQSMIEGVDATVIRLVNNSCVDYFVRVTAQSF